MINLRNQKRDFWKTFFGGRRLPILSNNPNPRIAGNPRIVGNPAMPRSPVPPRNPVAPKIIDRIQSRVQQIRLNLQPKAQEIKARADVRLTTFQARSQLGMQRLRAPATPQPPLSVAARESIANFEARKAEHEAQMRRIAEAESKGFKSDVTGQGEPGFGI